MKRSDTIKADILGWVALRFSEALLNFLNRLYDKLCTNLVRNENETFDNCSEVIRFVSICLGEF